jgi:hypothetical protein
MKTSSASYVQLIVRIPRDVIIAATIFAMTLAVFTGPGAGIRAPLNTLASKHT